MVAWVVDRESVSSDFLEGEVVAIHLGTGIYYSLRGTAAVLWQAMAQPSDAHQLAAILTSRFAVPADSAQSDVEAFLTRLQAESLVRPAESSAAVALVTAVELQTYCAPELERFADLQDLLLLDPIHDVGAQGWPHRPPPNPQP